MKDNNNSNTNSNIKCDTHGPNCDGACVDPNVDNGMTTKIWGPPLWMGLHCITFGYPYAINPDNQNHKTKKEDYKMFFYYLGKVLPCKYCRESYMDFIKEHPIDNNLDTRKDITKWLYDIHNKVNDKLGVPPCSIPSHKETEEYYEQYRAKCSKTTTEERENSLAKGCITPATGKKKRCILKIVDCPKNDITRQSNTETIAEQDLPSSDDYYLLEKQNFWKCIIIYTIVLLIILYCLFGNGYKVLSKTMKSKK